MSALTHRLDEIERQIFAKTPRVVPLKGVLRKTRISAREISAAKRSLFPPAQVK